MIHVIVHVSLLPVLRGQMLAYEAWMHYCLGVLGFTRGMYICTVYLHICTLSSLYVIYIYI